MGRRQLIVVLVLAVAACGDASEGSATGESPADGSGVECIPTPESAESIAEGFTVTGATLENPFAVELPEENALGLSYLVAAEIDVRGVLSEPGDIGLWGVGELGGGPIIAVDGFARVHRLGHGGTGRITGRCGSRCASSER